MSNGFTVSQNMILGSICAVVQIGANLISYPVFLHYLGYRRYGIWLTLAVVLNVVQFISAGLNPTLTQAVAQSVRRGRREELAQYVIWSLVGTIGFGLSVLLLWPIAVGIVRAIGLDSSLVTAVTATGPWLALLAGIALAAECAAALAAGVEVFTGSTLRTHSVRLFY